MLHLNYHAGSGSGLLCVGSCVLEGSASAETKRWRKTCKSKPWSYLYKGDPPFPFLHISPHPPSDCFTFKNIYCNVKSENFHGACTWCVQHLYLFNSVPERNAEAWCAFPFHDILFQVFISLNNTFVIIEASFLCLTFFQSPLSIFWNWPLKAPVFSSVLERT